MSLNSLIAVGNLEKHLCSSCLRLSGWLSLASSSSSYSPPPPLPVSPFHFAPGERLDWGDFHRKVAGPLLPRGVQHHAARKLFVFAAILPASLSRVFELMACHLKPVSIFSPKTSSFSFPSSTTFTEYLSEGKLLNAKTWKTETPYHDLRKNRQGCTVILIVVYDRISAQTQLFELLASAEDLYKHIFYQHVNSFPPTFSGVRAFLNIYTERETSAAHHDPVTSTSFHR